MPPEENENGATSTTENTKGTAATATTTAAENEPKSKPKGEEEYTIKVDGIEKVVSRDELINLAQKSAGADKRFQEAAALREKAQRGTRAMELFDRLSDSTNPPSKADITELAGLLKLDAGELAAWLEEEEDPNSGTQTETNASTPSAGQQQRQKLTMDDLPDEVKQILTGAKQTQMDAAIALVKKEIKEALDKDDIIAKMKETVKDAAGFDEVVQKKVFEDVQRRIILAGEQYGPELIADAIQATRSDLKKFGIPSRASEQPVPNILGLGPSGTLPAEVQTDEPIKRVPSTEEGYEDNVVQRVQQKVLQAFRKARK